MSEQDNLNDQEPFTEGVPLSQQASSSGQGETSSAQAIYRVDKFIVPAAGRDEFLARVHDTHAVLRAQAGFLQDMILEQQSGPGAFNFVTVVEWVNADVVGRVSEAVAKRHAELGFDRHEMMARLGIQADIANYARVAPSA